MFLPMRGLDRYQHSTKPFVTKPNKLAKRKRNSPGWVGLEGLESRQFMSVVGYTLTELPSLGANTTNNSYALDINNSGIVVGYSDTDGGAQHPVQWVNSTPQDLGTLGGDQGAALAINADGVIVGSAQTDGNAEIHAFKVVNGTITDLGTLGGAFSVANGVADNGTIVGGSLPTNLPQQHAFATAGGGLTDLGVLSGGQSSANDVNNGVIVGQANVLINNQTFDHPFRYSGGTLVDLMAGQAANGQALAIEPGGTIVGWTQTNSNQMVATRFTAAGTAQTLGTLSGLTLSMANDINSKGVIVGTSSRANNADAAAFVVLKGQMRDLNTMLDADAVAAGWDVQIAQGINDNGDIVGYGTVNGVTRAFVLTPVDDGTPDDSEQFGKINGKNVKANITDSDGTNATISLSGPGVGTISSSGNGYVIVLTGTTDKSVLKVTTKGSGSGDDTIIIESIQADGSVKSILATKTVLQGGVDIGGTASKIQLGNVSGGDAITIANNQNAAGKKVTIMLGDVDELSINSALGIQTLKTGTWHDRAGAADVVSAPWLGTLTAKGDFEAGLDLDGQSGVPTTLKTVNVSGNLSQSDWTIGSGDIGNVTIKGLVDDSDLTLAGNAKGITAGAIRNSNVAAGNLTDALKTISKFVIKGLNDATLNGSSFINTNVTADTLGGVKLAGVQTSNNGTAFGLTTHHLLKPYSRDGVTTLPPTGVGDFDAEGDYVVKVV